MLISIVAIVLFALVFRTMAFRTSTSIPGKGRLRTTSSRLSKLDMAIGSIAKISFKVSSLQKSINFYTKALGMDVDQREDEKVSLSFGGDIALELEESGDALDSNLRGDGFIGIGVAFPDAKLICDAAQEEGGSIIFPFGEYAYGASLIPDEDELKQFPVKYGKIQDPDGYTIEVMQAFRAEPLFKAILCVTDLDDSISFYTSKLGLRLLRKRSNINSKPKTASFVANVGAGASEEEEPYLELVYRYATEKLSVGQCLTGITLTDCATKKDTETFEPSSVTASAISDLDGYPLLLP